MILMMLIVELTFFFRWMQKVAVHFSTSKPFRRLWLTTSATSRWSWSRPCPSRHWCCSSPSPPSFTSFTRGTHQNWFFLVTISVFLGQNWGPNWTFLIFFAFSRWIFRDFRFKNVKNLLIKTFLHILYKCFCYKDFWFLVFGL